MFATKPQNARVDRSRTITRGLRLCWLARPIPMAAGVTHNDLLGNALEYQDGNNTTTDNIHGTWGSAVRQINAAADDYLRVMGSHTWLGDKDLTVVLGHRKTDLTDRDSYGFGLAAFGAKTISCTMPFSDGNVYWDYGGFGSGNRVTWTSADIDTKPHIWGFTVGNSTQEIWRDGVRKAVNAASDASRTASNSTDSNQFHIISNGSASDASEHYFVYVWNRMLTRSEMTKITHPHGDPFFFLRPRRVIGKAPVAGGASVVVLRRRREGA